MRTIEYNTSDSVLGRLLTATLDNKLCMVTFDYDDNALMRQLTKLYQKSVFKPGSAMMNIVQDKISNPTKQINIELYYEGSVFAKQVWHELKQIKCGSTMSYQAIAEKVGGPDYSRAVAQICGLNPIAIIIPCHRAVGKNSIGGYRWGVEKKHELLQLEGVTTIGKP